MNATPSSARVTGTELARLRRVDRRTVVNWLGETPACPSHGEGTARRFDLNEFATWWADRSVRHAAPSRPVHVDEAAERARKMRADADLSELKVAERRRELVEVATVLRSDERLLGVLRSRVKAIRGKWAPRVMGLGTMADATSTLDALADDILAALAEGADDLETDDHAAAAA